MTTPAVQPGPDRRAELVAAALTAGAEQRRRVATRAAAELAEQRAKKIDVRTGAVRVIDVLAEADNLEQTARALRTGELLLVAAGRQALRAVRAGDRRLGDAADTPVAVPEGVPAADAALVDGLLGSSEQTLDAALAEDDVTDGGDALAALEAIGVGR